MIEYAVKIITPSKKIRVASDRLRVDEGDGEFDYLPHIVSIDTPTYNIGMGDAPGVPSYDITIWDAHRRITNSFESSDYQSSRVELREIKDGELIKTFFGYMDDYSFSDGQVSFTARADESAAARDLNTYFEVDSFQKFEIMTPSLAEVVLNLKQQDTPWVPADIELSSDPSSSGLSSSVIANLSPDLVGEVDRSEDMGGGIWRTYLIDGKIRRRIYNFGMLVMNGPVYEYSMTLDPERYSLHSLDRFTSTDPEGATYSARLTGKYRVVPQGLDTPPPVDYFNEDTYIDVEWIEHEELTTGDGRTDGTFAAGERYLLTDRGAFPQSFNWGGDNAGDTLVIKRAARLYSYETYSNDNLASIVVDWDEGNAYPYWYYDQSDGFWKVQWEGLFQSWQLNSPTQNGIEYCTLFIIGSPEDEMQLIARAIPPGANGRSRADGRLELRINALDFGDTLIEVTGEIKKFLDSKPEVRPIRRDPSREEWVAATDVMIVNHNNFFPVRENQLLDVSSGQLGRGASGYISMGKTYTQSAPQGYGNSQDVEVQEVYRFRSTSFWAEGTENGTVRDIFSEGYLALHIENQGPISDSSLIYVKSDLASFGFNGIGAHPSFIDQPGMNFPLPIRSEISAGSTIRLITPEWILKNLSFRIENLEGLNGSAVSAGTTQVVPELTNRWRGRRVDLLLPMTDILEEGRVFRRIGSDPNQMNEDILLQGSEMFGVVQSSEIIVQSGASELWIERLSFSVPAQAGNIIRMLSDESSLEKDSSYTEVEYINKMIYPLGAEAFSMSEAGSFPVDEARSYFRRKSYRLIKNGVPENSSDLGLMFPIVYGRLKKVPLMHVIGTKVMTNEEVSAGDDVYVFSANKTGVRDASDIDIYLGEELEQDTKNDLENFTIDYLSSPLAKVVYGPHYVMVREERPTGVWHVPQIQTRALRNPYYRLQELEDRDGKKLYGIKLNGDLYEPKLRRLDKRHPIRHGLGSTKLFASYTGPVANDRGDVVAIGEPYTHPIDVIEHYLREHGQFPYSNLMIDRASADKVKSLTRRYEVSVYINEYITPPEFINRICMQCGIWWMYYGNKIYFTISDLSDVNWSKCLTPSFNIIGPVSEVSDGYAEIHNEVTYSYAKNWIDESMRTIRLDRTNNEWCRKASRARGEVSSYEVEAMYVTKASMARDVSRRLAKVMCSKKVTYELEARQVEDFDIKPGDIIPMTYPPFGLLDEPVLVTSVNDSRHKSKIQVVRFPRIFRRENGEGFELSPEYNCQPFEEI